MPNAMTGGRGGAVVVEAVTDKQIAADVAWLRDRVRFNRQQAGVPGITTSDYSHYMTLANRYESIAAHLDAARGEREQAVEKLEGTRNWLSRVEDELRSLSTVTDEMVERTAAVFCDALWPGCTLDVLNEPNRQVCLSTARRALTAALHSTDPARVRPAGE